MLEHRLAAQPLAEARGELLLGDLLVVLAELPEALQAEVSAVHLARIVGRPGAASAAGRMAGTLVPCAVRSRC